MNFDWTIRGIDIVMIFAVLFGPIIAVRLTRYLDDKKEIRGRKLLIYKTLMATRSYVLSPQHVEALNRISLEFSLKTKHDIKVLSCWRQYLDWLGDKSLPLDQWGVRRMDLFIELMYQMGLSLGYDYDKTMLKNEAYIPTGHEHMEQQHEAIFQGLVNLLQGKAQLPIKIVKED